MQSDENFPKGTSLLSKVEHEFFQLDEWHARREVLIEIKDAFGRREKEWCKAFRALRCKRPERSMTSRNITYKDLFPFGEYVYPNLKIDDQIAILPDVVSFVINDKKSYGAEWSGMLLVESSLNVGHFVEACSTAQKRAVCLFLLFLIKWRLHDRGCGIFKSTFEFTLHRYGKGIASGMKKDLRMLIGKSKTPKGI